MKISVIIPTFKPQKYLYECLLSLKNQTLDKSLFEIVLVLNGCREPYYTEIQDFLRSSFSDIKVKYLQTDIPGVSHARNFALDVADGDFITFLDDDDSLSPTCLEEMLNMAGYDTVVECYPYSYIDGCIQSQIPDSLSDAYDECVQNSYFSLESLARKFFSGPCMKLFHRSILEGRKYDERFKNGEDSIYMFLISDRIKNVIFTSKEAIYYRRYRKGSAISSSRSLGNKVSNCLRCMFEYTKIYFKGGYSAYFYFTRILAECKSIVLYMLNKK